MTFFVGLYLIFGENLDVKRRNVLFLFFGFYMILGRKLDLGFG